MPDEQAAEAARGRVKAEIGLPPQTTDRDAVVTYMVGTDAQFKASPIPFDKIIHSGNFIDLQVKTTQRIGVVADQIVAEITVLPGAINSIDEIAQVVTQFTVIAWWFQARIFRKVVINRVVMEVQRLRLKRATTLRAGFQATLNQRLRAGARSARLTTGIGRRAARQAQMVSRIRSVRFIAVRGTTLVALKALLIVGAVIETVLLVDRVFKGAQRAKLAGAIGAFEGGIVDIFTLGLIEEFTFTIEQKVARTAARFGEFVGV